MAFQSVEKFLNGLESELNKYAKSLRDQGFTSTNMLKFLKLKDLQNIPFVVPAPHRRMILSAVAKLQSPGSKFQIESPQSTTVDTHACKKRKTDGETSTEYKIETSEKQSTFAPKTLFSDGTLSKGNNSAYDIVLQDKLELEKKHALLKAELSEYTSKPVELMPLALAGSRVMMVTCTRCHHRGHRKDGNKNGAVCEFEPCVGYHYCGNQKLHPEFKTKKREVRFPNCIIMCSNCGNHLVYSVIKYRVYQNALSN